MNDTLKIYEQQNNQLKSKMKEQKFEKRESLKIISNYHDYVNEVIENSNSKELLQNAWDNIKKIKE